MTDPSDQPVAIVGSGLIGRAWAISFARAGHPVRLFDQQDGAAEAALDYIDSVLGDLAANDLLNVATPASVRARMRVASDLADALDSVVHVQENTPEDVSIKRVVFAELDQLAPPGAVLASSSSAIVPSQYTEALPGRTRCVGLHPINPPYLIPAVEIIPSPWTSQDTIARARALMLSAGQAPMLTLKEVDGFIMNRMQAALMEEAFRLIEEGVCSVEDVDIGIRDGLALRWSFMGPFETIDLNAPDGVRDYVTRYRPLFDKLHASMQWRADWSGPALDRIEAYRRGQVAKADLPARARWRDRRLMALLRHKQIARRDIGS